MKEMIFSVFVVCVLFAGCNKEPVVESQVYEFNYANYYLVRGLDLNGDGFADAIFEMFHSDTIPGNDKRTFNIIMPNDDWKIITETHIDTLCMDTVVRNGYETFDIANCNGPNVYTIDTSVTARSFDNFQISTVGLQRSSNDTVPLFHSNYSQPTSPANGAKYYDFEIGFFKGSNEGYIVFENDIGQKMAVHLVLEHPLFIVDRFEIVE